LAAAPEALDNDHATAATGAWRAMIHAGTGGHVASDGPSDKAGVRHGDRVTAIDGAPIHELAEFYRTLWRHGDAGVTVRLGVTRQDEQREIEVKTIDRYRYLKLDTTY
jgi:S1-C subfamily serine protease